LAGKYPGVGGMVYCVQSPLRYIDPTGEELYEFDENGYLLSKSGETGSKDQLQVKKSDGSTVTSKEFSNGAISTQTDKKGNQYYKIIGDDNGREMFEFLADNSTVEWGHAQMGKGGEKGTNYLFTSHNKENVKIVIGGDYLRVFNHNHPSGDHKPSDNDLKSYDALKLYNLIFRENTPDCYIYTTQKRSQTHYSQFFDREYYKVKQEFIKALYAKPSK
jgi:hypothetical protein